MKALHMVAFILVIVGAINWFFVVINFNLVEHILAAIGLGGLTNIVYVLVALSGVYIFITHKNDCKICSKG